MSFLLSACSIASVSYRKSRTRTASYVCVSTTFVKKNVFLSRTVIEILQLLPFVTLSQITMFSFFSQLNHLRGNSYVDFVSSSCLVQFTLCTIIFSVSSILTTVIPETQSRTSLKNCDTISQLNFTFVLKPASFDCYR